MFIPIILCLVSLTLAEPPVDNGYAAARSSHDDYNDDHHSSDHQKSLSQEYGPPSETFGSARNAPSDGYEYNGANSRNSPNPRARSQKHTPATVRVSFNQRFSSAAARNSAQDPTAPGARSFSQEHAAPNGPPAARSLSQEYGVPSIVSARTLSSEYGMPDARSTPSQEYGVPVVAARNSQNPHSPASNFRNAQPGKALSQDYSAPAARSQFQSASHGYSAQAASRSSNEAQSYDAPKPFAQLAPASRNSLSTYGLPTSRSKSSSHDATSATSTSNEVSQDYDSLNQRDLSEARSATGLSQEYGVPSSRSNQMTSAVQSTYSSARSSPSATYRPAARSASPSDQYGVPEQHNAGNQGYDLARARAFEELQNQEPANYDFGYQIEDQESGSDFGHTETREEDRAQGSYFVVRPDGTKQTVEYEADERGFRPRISVEPAAAAGGYDENAADIARSSQGPY